MSAVSRFLLPLLPLFMAACVNLGTADERRVQARQLSLELQQLSSTVQAVEADKLALTAIEESARLSDDFNPLCFPWMNNGLVNTGLRKRGLCYQWRDDLFPYLHRLNLQTLTLHLTSSRRATMREHNAIVVTAKGQRFEDGLVIDPWRKGGRLWWGRLSDDKGHPWKPLPRDLTPVVLRPLLMPELYLKH